MWCLLAIHGRHCLVECSFHGHDLDQVNHQGVANGLEFLLKRFQLLLQFGNRLVLALFGLTGQEHISNLRKHLVTTHKEQNSDQTQTRPNYLRKHQNINRTNRLFRSNCLWLYCQTCPSTLFWTLMFEWLEDLECRPSTSQQLDTSHLSSS